MLDVFQRIQEIVGGRMIHRFWDKLKKEYVSGVMLNILRVNTQGIPEMMHEPCFNM